MTKNLSPRGLRLTSLALFFIVPVLAALLVVTSPAGRTSDLPAASESAAAAATVAEPASQVLPKPWTAVGSTGAVDESSLNLYAFSGSDIGFKVGANGNVVTARYNVTNTFDNNASPNKPGWTTLEMGSNAPINTIIEAKLFEIKACTLDPVLICTARNRSMDNPCAKCTIQGTIDFTNKLYFVEVTLTRPAGGAQSPRMQTLRIF